MNIPAELKYSKEHEWLRVEGDTATVGITAFAQGELGDIIYVDVDCLGESFEANAVFGGIEAVKTVSDLFMPVTGKVSAVNKELDSNPESVNKDPYGKGWMIKVEMKNPSEVNSLLSAADYKALIGH